MFRVIRRYDPVGKANVPVACVDWCDAAAYCKWEGKHLCGRLDAAGSNPPASFADANKSAWYRACSHAGDLDLPYGNGYDGMKCVGLDNFAIFPLAVPHTDCEGGYSGLYDMSGNVAEWEDSCAAESGATDQCLARGGSYLDTNKTVGSAPSLLCNSNVHGSPKAATRARSTRDKEIGFRCCGDALFSP
ncbi:MAG TPA: SUMF1/EgtB/PvdO family nonheme iron enzyme [Polyangiaceae bacterium]|nr:SUMF1/EgtB/PvdO family nonheme iron enzyme [Polyangiaceae bacterium]